jgi:plastocyanin
VKIDDSFGDWRTALTAIAFAGAVSAMACGGSQQPQPAQAPPPDAKRVDPATAATISGQVRYSGPAPVARAVKLESDPVCAREHPNGMAADSLIVNNGALENVFVYVQDGLANYYFDPPTETVKLDQKGCRYSPHVFGLRVGQPVEISNSDPTMHNVHAMANANQEFNMSQAIQGIKNTKAFTAPEIMVHFKCNVHNWMEAYAGVVAHPYFAVSAGGGGFELKNLPPGTYTIAAWHEKLGTQTQKVTLADKESKAITFTFEGKAGTE